ncbi:SDR family oxidoreductase [Methylobacillus sp. Pita1]|uniref:SDR family oxidoreductase n=1 Tax=Methylobacillus sp. Pita1 TaxID=3382642 RepID=UPI0038B564B7
MKIFVTGATGWVGARVVQDLVDAGHRVAGMARSAEKARALTDVGAHVVMATLEELDVLREIASDADAVIHTAFNHDFSRFLESCEEDRRVIQALGRALEGSGRPMLVTSGLSGLPLGATENDLPSSSGPRQSEATARLLAARGIRAATVRLPPSVHGVGDHGFMAVLAGIARKTGVSAYVGNGQNCWSAVARADASQVYKLALETGVTESVYHAVAEEAIPFKSIAEAIGKQLGLPVVSRPPEHFGWFARMAANDMTVSAEYTKAILNWEPKGSGLLSDLELPEYFSG